MLGDPQPGEITEVSAEEIAVKLSWRSGNLIFRGEFLEEAVKERGIGNTFGRSSLIGMYEAHLNKVLGYIELGKEQGAEPVLTCKQVLQETGGFYLSPTIFDQVDPNARIAQEEIFGPVLSVIGF